MFKVRMTSRTAAALVAAMAVAAPAAYAVPAPEVHGTANETFISTFPRSTSDLRSPDVVDAAQSPKIDRRSPDAIDAGRAVKPTHSSSALPSSTATQSGSSGFDWGDAGIGAAAMLALAGAAIGTATAVGRHRRRGHGPAITAG